MGFNVDAASRRVAQPNKSPVARGETPRLHWSPAFGAEPKAVSNKKGKDGVLLYGDFAG